MLETSEATIGSSDVDALLLALKVFNSTQGFPELRAKLTEWATKHNARMKSAELAKVLEHWCGELVKAQSITGNAFPGEEVHHLLSKIGDDVSDALRKHMLEAMPHVIHQVYVQAWGAGLQAFGAAVFSIAQQPQM